MPTTQQSLVTEEQKKVLKNYKGDIFNIDETGLIIIIIIILFNLILFNLI